MSADQFLGLELPHERVFRGLFNVRNGDRWSSQLSDTSNPSYITTAQAYTGRLDSVYRNSVFKNVFIRAEVLGFDRYLCNYFIPSMLSFIIIVV